MKFKFKGSGRYDLEISFQFFTDFTVAFLSSELGGGKGGGVDAGRRDGSSSWKF